MKRSISLHRALVVTFAAGALALSACGNDDGMNGDAGTGDAAACAVQPTFASIHTNLLASARCTVCHGGATPLGDLKLDVDAATAHAALMAASANTAAVQPNRVVAGQPGESFFYVKISDDDAPSGRMPPGATLPACEIEAVRTWIENGAEND